MGWVSSRFHFSKEALSVTRLIAIPSVFALALLVFRVLPILAHGRPMTLGIPDWFWSLDVAFLALFVFVFEYGHRLYIRIQPRMKLSFDGSGAGVAQAVEQILQHGAGQFIGHFKASYVRVRADLLSDVTVKDCTAFITGVGKVVSGAVTPMVLPQPVGLRGEQSFNIHPKVPCMIDFVKVGDWDNVFTVQGRWPLVLLNEFNSPGTYRFTNAVNGDGVSAIIVIDVIWGGVWNAISATEVAKAS